MSLDYEYDLGSASQLPIITLPGSDYCYKACLARLLFCQFWSSQHLYNAPLIEDQSRCRSVFQLMRQANILQECKVLFSYGLRLFCMMVCRAGGTMTGVLSAANEMVSGDPQS